MSAPRRRLVPRPCFVNRGGASRRRRRRCRRRLGLRRRRRRRCVALFAHDHATRQMRAGVPRVE